MNDRANVSLLKRAKYWSGFLLMLPLGVAAENVEILLDYQPSSANPGANRFVNVTPVSAVCRRTPAFCGLNDLSSVDISLVTVPTSIAAGADIRQGAMIRINSDIKQVHLTHHDSGSTATMDFQLTGVGADYEVQPDVLTITGISFVPQAHAQLWRGGNWQAAPAGCVSSGQSDFGRNIFRFAWLMPSPVDCGKVSAFDIPEFRFKEVQLLYRMKLPNPLSLAGGGYAGTVTYTAGPGMDLDFGNAAIPSDTTVTFNIFMEVNHVLQLRVPPGDENVVLQPPGGWERWRGTGLAPANLSGQQNFDISSSGNFTVRLSCEHLMFNQCAMTNSSGDTVPVATRLTLPPGLETSSGPVNRQLLSTGDTLRVSSAMYVHNSRATLDFDVERAAVSQMLEQAGSTYSGNVTVIWDSDV